MNWWDDPYSKKYVVSYAAGKTGIKRTSMLFSTRKGAKAFAARMQIIFAGLANPIIEETEGCKECEGEGQSAFAANCPDFTECPDCKGKGWIRKDTK